MSLLRFFFSKYKYLVYTVSGNDKYSTIAGRLSESGVSYQTTSIRNPTTYYGGDNTQYEIYVKEEDKQKALQAIHR